MSIQWKIENWVKGMQTYRQSDDIQMQCPFRIQNLRPSENNRLVPRVPVSSDPIRPIRAGTGISGIGEHNERKKTLFFIDNYRLFYILPDDDTRRELKHERKRGDGTSVPLLLQGRLSIINEFDDFVILTSEGQDEGYWVDTRTIPYKIYDLGITPPVGSIEIEPVELGFPVQAPDPDNILQNLWDFLIGNEDPIPDYNDPIYGYDVETIITDRDDPLYETAPRLQIVGHTDTPPQNRASGKEFVFLRALQGGTRYYYLYTYYRDAPGEPFDGAESDPPLENIIAGTYADFEYSRTGRSNNAADVTFQHSDDPQVTGVRIYRSNGVSLYADGGPSLEHVREWRLVGEVTDKDRTTFLDDVVDIEEIYIESFNYAPSAKFWYQQPLLDINEDGSFRNSRLPQLATQISYYNGYVFAVSDSRLIYSDIRDGRLALEAFPTSNSIPVTEVEFVLTYFGTLLFGGSSSLWRLTGLDISDFVPDEIAGVGPVGPYAVSILENSVGFISRSGLFMTDTTDISRVSSPALDGAFENRVIRNGSVVQVPDGSVLWSVEFDDGNQEQYLQSGTEFYAWQGVHISQWIRSDIARVVAGVASPLGIYYVGDGRNINILEWENKSGASDVEWEWVSQDLNWQEEGMSTYQKRFQYIVLEALGRNVMCEVFVGSK